jgi:hypothetical protein
MKSSIFQKIELFKAPRSLELILQGGYKLALSSGRFNIRQKHTVTIDYGTGNKLEENATCCKRAK